MSRERDEEIEIRKYWMKSSVKKKIRVIHRVTHDVN